MPKRSFVLGAYRGVTGALGPLLAPALLHRRLSKGKEVATRIQERRGIATRPRPEGPLVWLHGASVGELTSILPLVDAMVARGFQVLVTSGTATSARLAATRLPPEAQHQFIPVDVPGYVARFLDHWQPDLAIFAESELWPNLLIGTAERGVPVVLANARMSERSFGRWLKVRGAARALLERMELCLAQTADDARRLSALGAPRVEATGNLKFDVPPPPAKPEALAPLVQATRRRPVFVAASTHPGEEEVILESHERVKAQRPDLLSIIVPRHPERGADLEAQAKSRSFRAGRHSLQGVPDLSDDVYVVDTLGELGLFYRIADVAFVGGTLVDLGGHNPIEPAKLGAPIVHGPHCDKSAELFEAFDRQGGAVEVRTVDDLARAVGALVSDESERERMRRAAHDVVASFSGALGRTLAALEPYLMQIKLRAG